jgi:hypothetical protein
MVSRSLISCNASGFRSRIREQRQCKGCQQLACVTIRSSHSTCAMHCVGCFSRVKGWHCAEVCCVSARVQERSKALVLRGFEDSTSRVQSLKNAAHLSAYCKHSREGLIQGPPACRHAQPFLPDTWACNCHTDTRLVVARFDTAERSQFCTCMLAQDKTDDSSTRQSASAPAANASALVVARRRLRAPAGSYVRLADPSLVHDASTLTPLHHLA